MVSVAASGSTSWVCDPNLEIYALEQPEMLRSPYHRHKCHAPFKYAPTVLINTISILLKWGCLARKCQIILLFGISYSESGHLPSATEFDFSLFLLCEMC